MYLICIHQNDAVFGGNMISATSEKPLGTTVYDSQGEAFMTV